MGDVCCLDEGWLVGGWLDGMRGDEPTSMSNSRAGTTPDTPLLGGPEAESRCGISRDNEGDDGRWDAKSGLHDGDDSDEICK